ncbi:hypothetical protein [Kitasatospora sp. NPDC098663]|uniref:hypothetical protein n=1 Tax=Kitasatospora sp. NPDC098663 TaxID=3364096 RepID=UPI003816E37B
MPALDAALVVDFALVGKVGVDTGPSCLRSGCVTLPPSFGLYLPEWRVCIRVLIDGLNRVGRWFGRALLRYLVACVAPVCVVVLVLSAFAPGGHDANGFSRADSLDSLKLLALISLIITVPTLFFLFLVSFWAARGRSVRGMAAVLFALPPLLYLFAGAWPFLSMSALGVIYAMVVMPAPAPRS